MEKIIVTSPAFEEGGRIPREYTGRGEDISPELVLEGLDTKAESIAILMDDMGHPIPAFSHWVIWNIPPMSVIPKNISYGKTVAALGDAVQGRGYGRHRYRGPKPPLNWSHMYQYNVYVLDTMLSLPATARKRDVLRAMQGHILQQGALCGHYT